MVMRARGLRNANSSRVFAPRTAVKFDPLRKRVTPPGLRVSTHLHREGFWDSFGCFITIYN